MRWLNRPVGGRAFLVVVLGVVLGVAIGAGGARAGADQPGEQKNLQLEVIINGVPANMIGGFVLFGGNRLGATRNELQELGLRIQSRFPQEIVMLDDIPGLKYEYEERTQKISMTVENGARQG